jgi:hypothetical protein
MHMRCLAFAFALAAAPAAQAGDLQSAAGLEPAQMKYTPPRPNHSCYYETRQCWDSQRYGRICLRRTCTVSHTPNRGHLP